MPFTIDFATSIYFHQEGRGLLFGMSDPEQEPGLHRDSSDDWLPHIGAAGATRAPRLLDVGLSPGWAGLYEVTSDHNAVIGRADASAGFFYATGVLRSPVPADARGRRGGPGPLPRPPAVRGHRPAERGAVAGGARPETHIV